ncbi:MAG: hypothetical protein ACRC5C_02295, partial [Bacilli bacterium]
MKKGASVVILSSLMAVILLSCQHANNATIKENTTINKQQTKADQDLILKEQIIKISISNKVSNRVTVLEDHSSIYTLRNILSSAQKESGIVNIADPKFYMDVSYEDKTTQTFYL